MMARGKPEGQPSRDRADDAMDRLFQAAKPTVAPLDETRQWQILDRALAATTNPPRSSNRWRFRALALSTAAMVLVIVLILSRQAGTRHVPGTTTPYFARSSVTPENARLNVKDDARATIAQSAPHHPSNALKPSVANNRITIDLRKRRIAQAWPRHRQRRTRNLPITHFPPVEFVATGPLVPADYRDETGLFTEPGMDSTASSVQFLQPDDRGNTAGRLSLVISLANRTPTLPITVTSGGTSTGGYAQAVTFDAGDDGAVSQNTYTLSTTRGINRTVSSSIGVNQGQMLALTVEWTAEADIRNEDQRK